MFFRFTLTSTIKDKFQAANNKQLHIPALDMTFLTVLWSLLIFSIALPLSWSQDADEMKKCPTECHCTAMNMVYCGFEEGLRKLTIFPSFIPVRVKILSLFRNMITNIPEDSLRNLTQLTTLNLRSNKLRDLPGSIFRDLAKLKSFNAGHNELSTLPRQLFHGLNNLQEVYLDNNALQNIPEDLFQNLPSIKRLHLHFNKLKTFPGNAFLGTLSLQGLSLANNFLAAIQDETFRNQSALNRLNLAWNRISSIGVNLFNGLGSLTSLRLENNNITSIPQGVFRGLKPGTVVFLNGNPFYCDCKLQWLKHWLRTKAKYTQSSSRSRPTCSQPNRLQNKPLLYVRDDQFVCVERQWTEWSPWNACSVTCGTGTQVSIRRCKDHQSGRRGEKCKGKSIRTKSCHSFDCRASWTSWSEWSKCSKTCSSGNKIRTRSCRNSLTLENSDNCEGLFLETRSCSRGPCRVDGKWGMWSRWSSCSVTCSWGTRLRTRRCNNPRPQYGGKPCPTSERSIERETCYIGLCPVHGRWSAWSSWSQCTTTCFTKGPATGTRKRNRVCDNPVPQYGGTLCNGNATQQENCNSQACPVHGGWTHWSDWSVCSVTCSQGIQVRFRTCSNPSPQHGGQNCSGNSSDLRNCDSGPCPVHGNWAAWSQWSNCSKTCSHGTKSRKRTCSNPYPQFKGRHCSGQSTEIQLCHASRCPIHGKWSAWSEWSDCSSSCSRGNRSRTRTCTNPSPSNGGETCIGNDTETTWCRVIPCPTHGGWSDWTNWTRCTKSCGNGITSRHRKCENPHPQHGGGNCIGDKQQSKHCSQQFCLAVGQWTEWSNWTDCSKTCDVGQQTRTRSCKSPNDRSVQSARDSDCTGNETEMRVCSQRPCSDPTRWNMWSSWSRCPVSCGLGKQHRVRNCSTREGDVCVGPFMQLKSCYHNDCPVNGGWSNWSNWTKCSSSCGLGIQVKFRFCINPKPQFGGKSCYGENVLFNSCKIAKCREESHQRDSFWSSWTGWSQCSTTCSKGYQTRSRYCRKHQSPLHLGNCSGATGPVQIETKICQMKPCSTWSSWSIWEACSQSCGGGRQKRVRRCKSFTAQMTCQGENSQAVSCNTHPCPPTVAPITYPPKITLGLPNRCPDPEKPLNGYFKIIDQDGSYFVTYYCKKYYFLHGPKLRHCESDGTWSDYVPYCLPKCGESKLTHTNVQLQRLRIFGGGTSTPGLWPWQVALIVNGFFHCGGSLIAEDLVVTAAHCIFQRKTRKFHSNITVRLGVHDISSEPQDPNIQSIDSKEIIPHPSFNWRTFDSDLALVKLRWKANITDYVRPVCLPNKQQRRKVRPGALGVMLGWGLTEDDNPTTELQQVYMPVVEHSRCQKAYEKERWPVTSNMICAGYAGNSKDSCKRDSGGGFLFKDSKGNKKKWFLGGIISWGNPRCGTPGKYSVFTQINGRFLRWIKNYIYN